jgi:MYXO-CTERM domain-containing protein
MPIIPQQSAFIFAGISSLLLAGVWALPAQADVSNTIVQVNATATELLAAGYSQVGTAPFISERAGDCFVNGCFSLAGTAGMLPNRGFLTFQFRDFVNSPMYYNGLFSVLDVNYGASGLTRDALIGLINAQSSTTGVTALTTAQANNAQGTCSFNEWLNPALLNSVVLNWQPNPAPATGIGLGQIYTVAWDLDSAVPPGFQGSGVSLGGAYAVPAPSALALLALGGLAARRRR